MTITRIFTKEFLLSALNGSNEATETMVCQLIGSDRWSLSYNFVFKFEDKFYCAPYSVGATERQDLYPWEYENDEIEVDEVQPVKETAIVYK